jgi:hypothetical protein
VPPFQMPPPYGAELPLKVEAVMVSVPFPFKMPPPSRAELSLKVEAVMVSLPP